MRPPKPTKAELQLRREVDGLKTTIVVLRRELTRKQSHIQRLEYALCTRLHRIDQLFGLLERAHTVNRRLEQECERLAHLIAASPSNAVAVR